MTTLGGIGMMIKSARRAEWRQIGPLCVAAALTTPIGIVILLSVDPELMRRVIGAFVIVSAAALMMGVVYKGRRNMITSAIAGVFVGLAHGAVSLGGLTSSLYILSSEKSAVVQRAGILVISTMVSAIAAVILTVQGTVRHGRCRTVPDSHDPVRNYGMVRDARFQRDSRAHVQTHRAGFRYGARRYHLVCLR